MSATTRNIVTRIPGLTDIPTYPSVESSPAHSFPASADLLQTAVPVGLSETAVLPIRSALSMRRCHLTPIDRLALATINNIYYRLPAAFDDMPSYFTNDPEALVSLAGCIKSLFPEGHLRCLEICSGPKFYYKWLEVAETIGKNRMIDVRATDYAARPLQLTKLPSNLRLTSHSLSIQVPPPKISFGERYDVIVGTYAFDSTFLDNDVVLISLADPSQKDGLQWFELLFRVALLDTHPRHETVRQAFATDDYSNLEPKDLADLSIEHIAKPVELEDVCGDDAVHVRSRFAGVPPECRDFSKALSVPGGLISWIEAAFSDCIAPGGVFIVGDVGCFDPRDPGDIPYHRIGVKGAALFRTIDFLLAKRMLESRGYKVEVNRVPEMAKRYAAHREVTTVGVDGQHTKRSHQFWMVVKRGL